MVPRRGQLRTLITLLLAVVVPFSCCDVHSWFGAAVAAFRGGDAGFMAGFAGHHDRGCHHMNAGPAHDDAANAHGGALSTAAGAPSLPVADPHGCTCDVHHAKVLAGKKSTVDPPVVLAIGVVTWVPTLWVAPPPQRRVVRGETWAGERPPTGLLRLHCALTV